MKILIYFLIIVLWSINMEAKVKLPPLLSDNMVLQQKSNVRIWGKATPNSTVVVTPSWANKEVKTHADEKGCWELQITTPAASFEEYTLTLTDGEQSVTLQHLLIGEVWLCAGQSNMVMPLNGFDYCPISDSNNVIADAPNHPGIRMVTIKPTVKLSPQEYAEGSWQQPTTENAPKFSAAAYHYALTLQRTLQIPIGVITCAWGGSRVEGWLPKEILQTYKDEDLTLIGSDKTPVYLQSMLMYNGILYPCHKYTIKGFIWYQGESNVRSSRTYAERLATMVKHWRSIWKQGDLPFYYVQLSSIDRPSWTWFRDSQRRLAQTVSNTGMAVSSDRGDSLNVHPTRKKEIGERLAHWALNKTYGHNVIPSGPLFRSATFTDNAAYITFDYAKDLTTSDGDPIRTFEVAEQEGLYYPAQAVVENGKVKVWNDQVTHPKLVRYGWQPFTRANLVNEAGMPASTFRAIKE